jgi:hypothetical protein
MAHAIATIRTRAWAKRNIIMVAAFDKNESSHDIRWRKSRLSNIALSHIARCDFARK